MSFELKPVADKTLLYVMAADAEYGRHLHARFLPLMTGVGPVEAAVVHEDPDGSHSVVLRRRRHLGHQGVEVDGLGGPLGRGGVHEELDVAVRAPEW